MKKKDFTFKTKERKSINADLNDFCYFAKAHDFIEVTDWSNLDGFDITLNDKQISLTRGELDAIKALVKKLNKL
jgi:hypothetical protein